jgi:PAS domain S-box-containing protein
MPKENVISRKSARKKGATGPQPREVGRKIQSRMEDLLSPEQELDGTKSKYAARPERLTHPDLNSDHDDIANLVRNVEAAMVIVDKSLRIRRFTPGAAEILNVSSPDIGRPIADLPSAVIFAQLESMIRDVMANMTTKEQEVTDVRGVWHSLRVRPYVTRANKVEGAVLTLTNIDNQKRQAAAQKQAMDELRGQSELLHLAHDSIIVRDVTSVILFWNRGAEETYGWSAAEACGNVSHQFLKTEFPEPFDEVNEKLFNSGLWEGELIHRTRTGKQITVASRQVVQHDQNGRVVGILEINKDITLRKEAEESLRNLSARLLQLQDEERRRIARELHDSTGQSLAALVIHLSAVSARVAEVDQTTAGLLREAIQLSQTASDEIRTLSYLLHPPTLDHAGLRSALEWYVEGFTQRSKVKVDLKVSIGPNRLSEVEERTLFRIVQESLTNIFRHSGSETASVSIALDSGIVRLEVSDKGKGIPGDILRALNSSGGQLGVGVRGMRERLRQLGGWLQIRSRSDGTTLNASFPIREVAVGEGPSQALSSN